MHAALRPAAAITALAVVLAGCGAAPDDEPTKAESRAKERATSGWPAKKPAHGAPEFRAVVAGTGGELLVLDLASGKPVDELRVDGQARLTPAEDGTHVVAAQSEDDAVHVLDAGIRWEGHGDHMDPANVAPTLRPGKLTVREPIHVVPHGDHITVFGDGDGSSNVLHADGRGAVRSERVVKSSAHHGVGVALEDGSLLASIPNPAGKDELPIGVQVYDGDDKPAQKFSDCPELHGEYAASETVVLFGCKDGVLVLERKAATAKRWTARKVPNPAGLGPEDRVGAFAGEGTDRILATLGDKAVALVDLEQNTMKRIELPEDRAGFLWDPEWLQYVVLTDDGNLQAIDPKSGALKNATRVTDPFSYSWEKPTAIAAAGDAIYVTDPKTRRLTEVEVTRKGFTVKRSMRLEFAPISLAVVGRPPA